MNDISSKIGLYHNLFQICLILALIFLVLAVVLFFVLDMRSTIGYLTGRRAKKGIKELEAVTALSGRLMPKERANMQYVAQEMKDDMGVRQRAKPGIRKVEHAVEVVDQPATNVQQPAVVAQTPEYVEPATEVLMENAVEPKTQITMQNDSTAVLNSGAGIRGKFVIIRELMMIHTEEVI